MLSCKQAHCSKLSKKKKNYSAEYQYNTSWLTKALASLLSLTSHNSPENKSIGNPQNRKLKQRSLEIASSYSKSPARCSGSIMSDSTSSWDSPGKSTSVGCHFFLQGIFLTQGSNLSLLHCRWSWATRTFKLQNSKDANVSASLCMPAAVLYCQIKNVFLTLSVGFFFLYIICVKSIINLLQYSTI